MKSDFTFSKDDAHRFMPWHVGIMVMVASLLLCMALTLQSWVHFHAADYSGSLSVIIPGATDRLDEKTEAARALLIHEPNVREVKALSEAQLRKLLEPWIGTGDALNDIAIPVVMDVSLIDAKKPIDVKMLQNKLSAIASGIEVDSHEHWAEAFTKFSATLQWIAGLIAITILSAMALIIAFSARASLHLHARAVNLLHSMGATDSYIAGQFQNELFMLALRGAAPGCVLSGLFFWAMGAYIRRLDVPTLPGFDFTPTHIALLILMPFISGLIALIATRFSVIRQLRQVL